MPKCIPVFVLHFRKSINRSPILTKCISYAMAVVFVPWGITIKLPHFSLLQKQKTYWFLFNVINCKPSVFVLKTTLHSLSLTYHSCQYHLHFETIKLLWITWIQLLVSKPRKLQNDRWVGGLHGHWMLQVPGGKREASIHHAVQKGTQRKVDEQFISVIFHLPFQTRVDLE